MKNKVKTRHRLLQRQLKRYNLSIDSPAMEQFIDAIDSAYKGFDEDRALLERSLELSSQELIHASGQLKAILNAFPDLILRLDGSGKILTQKTGSPSPTANGEYIHTSKNHVGSILSDLIPVDKHGEVKELMRQVLQGREVQSMEYSVDDENSFQHHYELRLIPFLDREFIAVIRDITSKKRMEAEKASTEAKLRRAVKMQAVGRLAGGIAHDFNNILHSIMGYTQLARRKINQDSPASKNLQEVLIATNRGKELVEQILIFSRWKERRHLLLSLEELASEVESLIRPSLPDNVELSVTRSLNGSDRIVGDPIQLHQSLTNLFKNAIQSMREDGGTLSVSIESLELTEHLDTLGNSLFPGSYYCLVVEDTGPGMNQEVQDRVFEPFFTTKAPQEGTGLGLSVVHGVVQDHGGGIELESELGRGTKFKLYFPVSGDAQGLESYTSRPSQQIFFGSGRILLVDDEKALASVITEMLKSLGYSVTCFVSPLEAAKHFASSPSRYDIVLTDQTMPGLSGVELTKRLLDIRADIPVLILSGYSEDLCDNRALEAGCQGTISKPISLEELSQKVYDTLIKRYNEKDTSSLQQTQEEPINKGSAQQRMH